MIFLFAWVVLFPLIGAAIGQTRNNAVIGGLLGLLFGPLGCLLALVDDKRAQCPECLGRVPFGARKCRHCGSDIPQVVPVKCPACGQKGQLPEPAARGNIECPECKRVFQAGS